VIDEVFSHDSPLAILSDLERVEKTATEVSLKQWATKTIKTIRERSPIGVAVTLRALRQGRDWDIAQAFQNEHEIARVFMRHPDFINGVRARLVERSKERPNWQPNTLEDVTTADVDQFFAGINRGGLEFWTSGPEAKYKSYPHAWLALPTDAEIEARLSQGASPSEIIAAISKEKHGKVGVREKVEEVVERIRS
jgi:3-hydroxyisobutyryl-CoA hydrolase